MKTLKFGRDLENLLLRMWNLPIKIMGFIVKQIDLSLYSNFEIIYLVLIVTYCLVLL